MHHTIDGYNYSVFKLYHYVEMLSLKCCHFVQSFHTILPEKFHIMFIHILHLSSKLPTEGIVKHIND